MLVQSLDDCVSTELVTYFTIDSVDVLISTSSSSIRIHDLSAKSFNDVIYEDDLLFKPVAIERYKTDQDGDLLILLSDTSILTVSKWSTQLAMFVPVSAHDLGQTYFENVVAYPTSLKLAVDPEFRCVSALVGPDCTDLAVLSTQCLLGGPDSPEALIYSLPFQGITKVRDITMVNSSLHPTVAVLAEGPSSQNYLPKPNDNGCFIALLGCPLPISFESPAPQLTDLGTVPYLPSTSFSVATLGKSVIVFSPDAICTIAENQTRITTIGLNWLYKPSALHASTLSKVELRLEAIRYTAISSTHALIFNNQDKTLYLLDINSTSQNVIPVHVHDGVVDDISWSESLSQITLSSLKSTSSIYEIVWKIDRSTLDSSSSKLNHGIVDDSYLPFSQTRELAKSIPGISITPTANLCSQEEPSDQPDQADVFTCPIEIRFTRILALASKIFCSEQCPDPAMVSLKRPTSVHGNSFNLDDESTLQNYPLVLVSGVSTEQKSRLITSYFPDITTKKSFSNCGRVSSVFSLAPRVFLAVGDNTTMYTLGKGQNLIPCNLQFKGAVTSAVSFKHEKSSFSFATISDDIVSIFNVDLSVNIPVATCIAQHTFTLPTDILFRNSTLYVVYANSIARFDEGFAKFNVLTCPNIKSGDFLDGITIWTDGIRIYEKYGEFISTYFCNDNLPPCLSLIKGDASKISKLVLMKSGGQIYLFLRNENGLGSLYVRQSLNISDSPWVRFGNAIVTDTVRHNLCTCPLTQYSNESIYYIPFSSTIIICSSDLPPRVHSIRLDNKNVSTAFVNVSSKYIDTIYSDGKTLYHGVIRTPYLALNRYLKSIQSEYRKLPCTTIDLDFKLTGFTYHPPSAYHILIKAKSIDLRAGDYKMPILLPKDNSSQINLERRAQLQQEIDPIQKDSDKGNRLFLDRQSYDILLYDMAISAIVDEYRMEPADIPGHESVTSVISCPLVSNYPEIYGELWAPVEPERQEDGSLDMRNRSGTARDADRRAKHKSVVKKRTTNRTKCVFCITTAFHMLQGERAQNRGRVLIFDVEVMTNYTTELLRKMEAGDESSISRQQFGNNVCGTKIRLLVRKDHGFGPPTAAVALPRHKCVAILSGQRMMVYELLDASDVLPCSFYDPVLVPTVAKQCGDFMAISETCGLTHLVNFSPEGNRLSCLATHQSVSVPRSTDFILFNTQMVLSTVDNYSNLRALNYNLESENKEIRTTLSSFFDTRLHTEVVPASSFRVRYKPSYPKQQGPFVASCFTAYDGSIIETAILPFKPVHVPLLLISQGVDNAGSNMTGVNPEEARSIVGSKRSIEASNGGWVNDRTLEEYLHLSYTTQLSIATSVNMHPRDVYKLILQARACSFVF